jgi:hypothetical protein
MDSMVTMGIMWFMFGKQAMTVKKMKGMDTEC